VRSGSSSFLQNDIRIIASPKICFGHGHLRNVAFWQKRHLKLHPAVAMNRRLLRQKMKERFLSIGSHASNDLTVHEAEKRACPFSRTRRFPLSRFDQTPVLHSNTDLLVLQFFIQVASSFPETPVPMGISHGLPRPQRLYLARPT